jgi:hypothetical protein
LALDNPAEPARRAFAPTRDSPVYVETHRR